MDRVAGGMEQRAALDWLRGVSPRTWEMVMGVNPLRRDAVLRFVVALYRRARNGDSPKAA
jgi:hypothetical protein